eukprot:2711759-Rhodomonas_salina.1
MAISEGYAGVTVLCPMKNPGDRGGVVGSRYTEVEEWGKTEKGHGMAWTEVSRRARNGDVRER